MDRWQLEQAVCNACYHTIRMLPPSVTTEFLKRTLQQIWDEDVVHIGGEEFPYDIFIMELQVEARNHGEVFGGLTSADIIRNKDKEFSELVTDIGRLLGPI